MVQHRYVLGQLTDFSFPYRFGGRFYLGVRAVITVAATASGLGTASSVGTGATSTVLLRVDGAGDAESAVARITVAYTFCYRFGV
jgi:hypothetical protein